MSEPTITEILSEVREGLVAHPGDHLVLSFPADMTAIYADEISLRLQEHFGADGITVSIISGAEQIVVIRREGDFVQRGEDFGREFVAALRCQRRLGTQP